MGRRQVELGALAVSQIRRRGINFVGGVAGLAINVVSRTPGRGVGCCGTRSPAGVGTWASAVTPTSHSPMLRQQQGQHGASWPKA